MRVRGAGPGQGLVCASPANKGPIPGRRECARRTPVPPPPLPRGPGRALQAPAASSRGGRGHAGPGPERCPRPLAPSGERPVSAQRVTNGALRAATPLEQTCRLARPLPDLAPTPAPNAATPSNVLGESHSLGWEALPPPARGLLTS